MILLVENNHFLGCDLMMRSKKAISLFLAIVTFLCIFPIMSFAEDGKTSVVGKVYTFDKKSNYEISTSKSYSTSDKGGTYGKFSISGDIVNVATKDGVPSYEVNSENLNLFYTYGDSLLKENTKSWYLIEDKDKEIDGKKLDNKILKGTILLQVSKDRKNWSDISCTTDAFNKTPVQTSSFYKTTDVETLNGCFYRVTIVYQLKKLVETKKVLFFTTKDYEEKKIAEVYEFYAYSSAGKDNLTSSEAHKLGSKVRTKEFDGYLGEDIITDTDAHHGWDLGQFYVDGYTAKCVDSESNNYVFLKNVGDKVTLGFNLKQNIDKLDGKDNLKITSDADGYDAYFETKHLKFGRGTLIVRHTDYNGNKSIPQIYTNYLEANAKIGADTIVQLCEEGDYEVALDYEVTDTKGINKVGHYRIYFEFSVRNGNCMVYPFDVVTGAELTNSSMTENGFRIDMANSRYLIINIKRDILTESADGLVEDTRFNRPAKDGAEYTEEGIYTITVQNKYTGQCTPKKIYVGTNKVLKAHVATGFSVAEINNMVANGATISDDGLITLATNTNTEPTTEKTDDKSSSNEKPSGVIIILLLALVGVGTGVAWFVIKEKKQVKVTLPENDEGVMKQ